MVETDLEVLLEHEEEHAALRSDDGAVEGAAVVRGQPREDRVELVVEVLVVDVLRLARLEVVPRLGRRRGVEILHGWGVGVNARISQCGLHYTLCAIWSDIL